MHQNGANKLAITSLMMVKNCDIILILFSILSFFLQERLQSLWYLPLFARTPASRSGFQLRRRRQRQAQENQPAMATRHPGLLRMQLQPHRFQFLADELQRLIRPAFVGGE